MVISFSFKVKPFRSGFISVSVARALQPGKPTTSLVARPDGQYFILGLGRSLDFQQSTSVT